MTKPPVISAQSVKSAAFCIVLATASAWFLADCALGAAESEPGGDRAATARRFDEVFARWRRLLFDFADMQRVFRQAEPAERPAVERRWRELRAEGDKLRVELLEAAESAYEAAPNRDKAITDLLVEAAVIAVRDDRYEEGQRLSQLLLKHKQGDKRLSNLAAVSLYSLCEFEQARPYFRQAHADGALDPHSSKLGLTGPAMVEKWEAERKLRDQEAERDDLPRVLLRTSEGDITVELFEDQAPQTVANFVTLVEKGFFNGLKFHRVIGNFMAQGGDPKGNGTGGPGYCIADEFDKPDARLHFRGSISMANNGAPNTGGSQFFLTFRPTPELNGRHTVFGRMIKGFDVLERLQRTEGFPHPIPPPDRIIEAKLLRKRPHEYTFEKLPTPSAPSED